ncbi:high-affinity branched-chain amino acid transport ATP-binding protein BraF [Methanocaldococcus villosus KIN24-T80]|uniref:Probable branched-chain amino acid transport ATP-binding protein LivG n=1 Tax=Methanocaldococcus villosus KIN24-T80 TaxID=1069083 RepID=N6VUB3_9EURY|nr:ABC transporter ATP-binding protein [Methanocaldococcus villosus]ENN96786.1 high-affinity branched-chain amino acid transport ATP-binding protein BraF [Methanocaldococcus villosus KIN24-T80]
MEILKTENVTKYFGDFKALNNVSISVNKGDLTLIIGPNGSGKSTLINVITGFLKADSGKVYFEENDITNKEPEELYYYGIVRTFQTPQPLKEMTVLENILIGNINPGEEPINAIFYSKWLKFEEEMVERAFKILEFLKLSHLYDRKAGSLSGGQMKLLEIGRALMTEPKLIVMDEPIAGVAPGLAHDIFNHVIELKKKGITFLIVEHRLDIVLQYIDHLYVMFNGEIIAEGRGKEIENVINDPKVVEIYIGD